MEAPLEWLSNRCWCGAASPPTPLFVARDLYWRVTEATAGIMQCPACGTLFPERFPSAGSLPLSYGGYYTDRPPRGTGFGPRALINRTRATYLRRALPADSRRVLDYGCGSGAYLAHIAQLRPETMRFGTDIRPPSPGPAPFSWLAIDDLEAAAPFDWITLGHVIEHVHEPAALVSRLAGLLAPGGGLWIATPNAESFLLFAAGRCWRDIDFPRHRAIFSRDALARLLTDAGLDVDELASPRLNSALNTLTTLQIIGRDHAAPPGERASATLKTAVGLAGRLLQSPAVRRLSSPEIVIACHRRR